MRKYFEWKELFAAYVNLLHRQDRELHMTRELGRVGLEAVRYAATSTKDPDQWNHEPYKKMFARTPGAIGCMLSQMGVMRAAHAMGKGAMVFEDDLVFASDIKERLDYIQRFINEKEPDTDVFFLGGTVHTNGAWWHGIPHEPMLAPYCKCTLNRDHEATNDPHIFRVYGMFSTHAYIVPYDKIPKILSLLDSFMDQTIGIDFSLIAFQPELKCFAFLPGSVKQIDNQSDIGNGMTVFSGFQMLGPHWFADRVDTLPSPPQTQTIKKFPPKMPRYRTQIVKLLRDLDLPLTAAEVGVAEGRFSLSLLQQGIEKLYMVDLWEEQPGMPGDSSHAQSWHSNNEFEAKLRVAQYNGKTVQLKGYSTDMAKAIPDESLGLAYIDCNHAYEWVKKDIDAYISKVVPGGVVAFHDYLNHSYGVNRAVNEYASATGRQVYVIPDEDDSMASAWFIK